MHTQGTANIRQFLTRRSAKLGIPVSGTFELTPRCNLQCKMCYVRLTPAQMEPIGRELTAAQWLELARQARDAGMAFLLITGGEPTLRRDFCEIYEGLAQMGFSISVNTNGTMLTPQLRALWHRLPPAQVNVTLYGISREGYHSLCGNPDAFDAVMDGLNWLKAEGILTHLNTTMTPANYSQWQQIEKFAETMELKLRMTTYCFPPLRRGEGGACGDFSRLSPEDAAELALQDILHQEGMGGIQKRFLGMDTPHADGCSLDVGEPMQCMAGKSQFWVTWDGRLMPCGMLDTPAVSLKNHVTPFSAAWEQLRRESSEIRLCADCIQCRDRGTCLNCAAVTYTETGRFDGKPDYMCRYSKAYREILTQMAEK